MDSPSDATDCWFDEPVADDRLSWAMPSGHGTYRGLELEFLNRADELMMLLEAQHAESATRSRSGEEMIVDGEPFSPRLHLAMHQIVANQLLADDPPETWRTVQRLAGMGYDWHNVMHMIARLISDDVYTALRDERVFDPADYARRLQRLPGDWPRPPGRRTALTARRHTPPRSNQVAGGTGCAARITRTSSDVSGRTRSTDHSRGRRCFRSFEQASAGSGGRKRDGHLADIR